MNAALLGTRLLMNAVQHEAVYSCDEQYTAIWFIVELSLLFNTASTVMCLAFPYSKMHVSLSLMGLLRGGTIHTPPYILSLCAFKGPPCLLL